jgi:Protein of unknown function (DUF4232)
MDVSSRNSRLLAVILAAVPVLIGGCSSSAPSAGSKPAAVSPSAMTSTLPAPAAAARPGTCKSTALSVLLETPTVAGRSANYPIEFINDSGASCTLDGFPDVSFATGSDYSNPVGPTATWNNGSPEHLVTIPPEGTATAMLSMENAKDLASGCRQTRVTGILIHPPGLRSLVRVPFSGLTCANPRFHVLTVDAVRTGTPEDSDGD